MWNADLAANCILPVDVIKVIKQKLDSILWVCQLWRNRRYNTTVYNGSNAKKEVDNIVENDSFLSWTTAYWAIVYIAEMYTMGQLFIIIIVNLIFVVSWTQQLLVLLIHTTTSHCSIESFPYSTILKSWTILNNPREP